MIINTESECQEFSAKVVELYVEELKQLSALSQVNAREVVINSLAWTILSLTKALNDDALREDVNEQAGRFIYKLMGQEQEDKDLLNIKPS